MAKIVSLVVKVGALVFVIVLPTKYAIQLQLLGGIWIIQTLPAVASASTRAGSTRARCSPAGRRGMACGTYMAIDLDFKGSVYKVFGINAYEAPSGLALNLVVAVALHRGPARAQAPATARTRRSGTTTRSATGRRRAAAARHARSSRARRAPIGRLTASAVPSPDGPVPLGSGQLPRDRPRGGARLRPRCRTRWRARPRASTRGGCSSWGRGPASPPGACSRATRTRS